MSVVVVGSANLDLVYQVQAIPRPGETLLATGVAEHSGGKGNNQVIAAARAGATATLIGALGNDAAARRLGAGIREAGVVDLVRTVEAPTGTALISVSASAENTIVVNPGANTLLLELTKVELNAIRAANILLLQLEIPIETVVDAAETASRAGVFVVLNAAPIRKLPDELLASVDVLIVNEHEAAVLANTGGGFFDPAEAVRQLLESVPVVIVTLGAEGAFIGSRERPDGEIVPGISVNAIDTTGAGDTFCGAFTAALDEALVAGSERANQIAFPTLLDAARFATAASALSVQHAGATTSIPERQEIDAFRAFN